MSLSSDLHVVGTHQDEPDGMRSVRQREIVDSSPLKRRLVLEKAGERLSVEGAC